MYFTKIIQWFKDNWPILLIVVIILSVLSWRQCSSDSLYGKLMNDYNAQAKEHKQQIDELEKLNNARWEQQNLLNESYKKDVARIEKSYNEALQNITEERKKYQNKIVLDAKKDPTTLTTKVKDTFGIPIMEGK